MNQFGDLFKLEQDYIQTGDSWLGDEEDDFNKKTTSYYTIDQGIKVCVKRKEITIFTYYVMILVLMMMTKRKTIKLTKINKLTLITNKNKEYLKSFINDCVNYHGQHK